MIGLQATESLGAVDAELVPVYRRRRQTCCSLMVVIALTNLSMSLQDRGSYHVSAYYVDDDLQTDYLTGYLMDPDECFSCSMFYELTMDHLACPELTLSSYRHSQETVDHYGLRYIWLTIVANIDL